MNTVPAAQFTNEDTARVFSTGNGNLLSVADVDATTLQLSLTATNGTLTLPTKTGLTFQAGDGTANPSMTFTGAIAALNTALNGLVFAPTPNFFGPASVTLLTSDQGATGAGGILTRTDTVVITVAPVNDLPIAVNDAVTLAEDAPATALDVRANDIDVDGDTLTITSVSSAAHGTVTTDGVKATYQPTANYNGADSFTYTISDGHGGTASAAVAVTVTAVNDRPWPRTTASACFRTQFPMPLSVLSNDSAAPDLGETLTITAFTHAFARHGGDHRGRQRPHLCPGRRLHRCRQLQLHRVRRQRRFGHRPGDHLGSRW